MKEIHSFDFIASEKELNQQINNIEESCSNLYDCYNVSNIKKYKVIIVEEKTSEKESILLKKVTEGISKSFSKWNSGYFDWDIPSVIDSISESRKEAIHFFFIYIGGYQILDRLKYFKIEQNLNFIYDDIGTGFNVLISYDQDTYNQIKLAFSNDIKISDFYSIDLKMGN